MASSAPFRSSSGLFRSLALFSALTVVLAASGTAWAKNGPPGFLTPQPAMITPLAPGSSVLPIMTVGETLGSGYKLESIPDGISLQTRGQGRVDLYLNHETSLVPFPFNPATGVGQSDYTNAMLSHLVLNQHSAGVLQGKYVIPSSANFQPSPRTSGGRFAGSANTRGDS